MSAVQNFFETFPNEARKNVAIVSDTRHIFAKFRRALRSNLDKKLLQAVLIGILPEVKKKPAKKRS